MNESRPARDDSDTEKLKALLRLLRGTSSSKKAEFQTTILEGWERSKTQSGTRPAMVAGHRGLINTLLRTFAFESFETSDVFNVSFFYHNLHPHYTGVS